MLKCKAPAWTGLFYRKGQRDPWSIAGPSLLGPGDSGWAIMNSTENITPINQIKVDSEWPMKPHGLLEEHTKKLSGATEAFVGGGKGREARVTGAWEKSLKDTVNWLESPLHATRYPCCLLGEGQLQKQTSCLPNGRDLRKGISLPWAFPDPVVICNLLISLHLILLESLQAVFTTLLVIPIPFPTAHHCDTGNWAGVPLVHLDRLT